MLAQFGFEAFTWRSFEPVFLVAIQLRNNRAKTGESHDPLM